MDLITQFPLGDDIAVTLLVLAVLSVAALIAGAVLPTRLPRDEDATDLDEGLGRRLGMHLASAGSVLLWVGLPALVLLYLVPGSTDQRILRSALMLVGLLLGPFAAWRGLALQLATLGVDVERRPALVARLGALGLVGAIAVAVLPVAIAVWFLQETASSGLMALAAGAAISALAIRVGASSADSAAAASALLVGTDENELEADDPANLGAPHLRTARMFRRGAALSADLVAVTTALAAAGILLGVPVLAGEGILVVLLGLGVTMLTGCAVAVMPHVGRPGHETGALRLGGLIPAVLGSGGLIAAAALWLPAAYQNLRFSHVGMDVFTDPNIAGPQPVPRAELEPQIEQATADMSQWISATDESQGARAFLDVLTLYTVSPSAVVAGALGLGALVALGAAVLLGGSGDRRGSAARRAARTSRTGGALGTIAGLSSSALTGAGALALLALTATVISVLSAGVPSLALALLAYAGLGALVVVAAGAGSLLAPTLLDRSGAPRSRREAGAAAATGPRSALLLAAAFPGLAVLGPIVTALQVAPRAASVWEDRVLHDVTPAALPLLAGVGLGVIMVLLASSSLLDAARRVGAAAVVDTRAAFLEQRDQVHLEDLPQEGRRAALVPVVMVTLMPVIAAFGLGPAALPGLVVGSVLTAAGLGLWTLSAGATVDGASAVIASGRYGGPGSWGHSGALGGAVLTGVLRSAIGSVALPLLLTSALVAALSVSAVTGMFANDSDAFLRWGIAAVGVLVIVACWVVAATAPEVDLEDTPAEAAKPLFAREVEAGPEDTLDAMSWEVDPELDAEEGRRR